MKFLPTSVEEGKKYYKDFTSFDVIFITGDPYYDHPLSGIAILSRLLDKKGYKVAIIAQPEEDKDYTNCGKPNNFFCITSGMLDSMLANYTPMLRERENVLVPEHAPIIYTQKIKSLYKDTITVLGGVEATIRRFTHFDYKENQLRKGILNDSKADVLLFGNAERSILLLLNRMSNLGNNDGHNHPEFIFEKIKDALNLSTLDGAAFRIKKENIPETVRKLPSYEECVQDKEKFNLLTRTHYLLPDDSFIEACGLSAIQHTRPSHTLQEDEMDLIYEFPYSRKLHPLSRNFDFNQKMVEMLTTSVVIGRGCWGSCSFCIIPLLHV